ncbi:alpha/beta-hydrolase [Artomyces pyxidatus]|uniref:Alpha/beta-hydrolase n=1 Tax=Artomyces pyxidatus TaxID=48021 RepID=A0ACB8SQ94_9AGAM|nr:alpha/beta-hydrolase [Artomyces pyxidatus]
MAKSFASIPRPPSFPPRRPRLPGRILPIHPPTTLPALPALPSPPRETSFGDSYILSTHVVPSCQLRTTPDVSLPVIPDQETKEERKARVERATRELFELKGMQERDELEGAGSEKILWNVLTRYVHKDAGKRRGKGLTLFMAHANGMHKETFEPMLQQLLFQTDSNMTVQIDEVWSIDAVQHGDSGILNAANLGLLFDWVDNTRDILNFFLHNLPETVSPEPLPVHLPRVSPLETEARVNYGFPSRSLVILGHSYGGCSLTLAAHNHPKLFSALVLVDPVIIPVEFDRARRLHQYISGAIARRDTWPSREEAYRLLSASPFFGAWSPDVLKSYVEHALAVDPSGQVKLKCSGVQEAIVFSESRRTSEAFTALEGLDPRIALKWLVPPPSKGVIEDAAVATECVWRRSVNASNSVINAGHLLVQEAPRETADALRAFLEENFADAKARL